MPRRKKKTLFEQLWTEATPLRKILTAVISTVVLTGSAIVAWGNISNYREQWYIAHYGIAPHASVAEVTKIEKFVDVLAQFSQGEINARQVQRQVQIDEIRARCNIGRCTQYERQSLNNLLEAWQREQATLEQLRNQQQQAPQAQYQWPNAARR